MVVLKVRYVVCAIRDVLIEHGGHGFLGLKGLYLSVRDVVNFYVEIK
jgi:hypothetical protein